MISVCMATYNGAKYIKDQIVSILNQLDNDDELIISDDGSSDGTVDIINEFTDKRIHLYHHVHDDLLKDKKKSKSFYYVTSNFHNALLNAKGDYIYLSDQDDIWIDGRVKQVQEDLKSFDIVMTNYKLIDGNNLIIKEKFYDKSPISNNLIINVIKSKYLGCCMAFNRKVLDYCLPFPKDLLAHDYWIGCLGSHKFKFYFESKPLHMYRRTGDNVSTSTEKSNNTLLYKILYRLKFLLLILKQIRIKHS